MFQLGIAKLADEQELCTVGIRPRSSTLTTITVGEKCPSFFPHLGRGVTTAAHAPWQLVIIVAKHSSAAHHWHQFCSCRNIEVLS